MTRGSRAQKAQAIAQQHEPYAHDYTQPVVLVEYTHDGTTWTPVHQPVDASLILVSTVSLFHVSVIHFLKDNN
jgi:hypothetical protein